MNTPVRSARCYVKLIQHNVNRQDGAHQTILEQAFTSHTDIILLQEPHCPSFSDSFVGLTHPSFHIVTPQPGPSVSSIAVRPRVLAYVRKSCDIEFTPRYDICNDPDMQIIEFFGKEHFYVVNVYNERQQRSSLQPTAPHPPISSQPPTSRSTLYTVERLLQHIRLDKPAVIAGDFNRHHPWWNSAAHPDKIAEAANLVDWLNSIDATLLVNGEEINEKGGTFHRPNLRSTSVIDLAFHTRFRKLEWGNWAMIEPTGSDHEVITFQADIAEPPAPTTNSLTPTYNYKKADWELFRKLLQNSEDQLSQELERAAEAKNHNLMAEVLTTAIRTAADSAIPKLRVVERSKPWWNEDLSDLRKLLNRAHRRYKDYSDDDVFVQDWKAARNTYFHAIRQAKQSYWTNFLEGAEGKDVFTAFRYTKQATHTKIPTIHYEKEGRKAQADTFEEKCTAFLTTLFPRPSSSTAGSDITTGTTSSAAAAGAVPGAALDAALDAAPGVAPAAAPADAPAAAPAAALGVVGPAAGAGTIPNAAPASPAAIVDTINLPQKSTCSASKEPGSNNNSKKCQWDWPALADSEIKTAIFSSSAKKAPGPDRIGFAIIQKAYLAIPSVMNKLYRALFNHGHHPDCWKESIGIILPKPNKPDYTIPKAYRVIALLNCLGKVLEKLFATRLAYLANTTGRLLNDTQLGGRRQRSAVDTAMLLLHHIQRQKQRSKKNITTSVLLDIKGAFDHVSDDQLLRILRSLQLPANLLAWVRCFLAGRNVQLAFEGKIHRPVEITGLPQGSPISPILFLIYVRNIVADRAFQLSYIDDFSISVSSTSAAKNCRALETIVQGLFQKAEAHEAQFDPGKTELIHFSPSRTPIEEGLTIAGLAVSPSPIVKWLGIHFDSRLTFETHIEKKINAATSAFFGLQRLGTTQAGLSFRALRQLYIACVTSIADFGVQLWWRGQKTMLKRYQRLQYLATQRMLGAFRGSPSRALELEAAIPPPSVRFEKACNNYSLRTLQFLDSHPIKQACYSLVQDELIDDEDQATLQFLRPTTQLTSLVSRLQHLTGGRWNVEQAKAQWETPWASEPQALISIASLSKDAARDAHEDLLRSIMASPGATVFYTDGSQGTVDGRTTNSAAICQLDRNFQTPIAKYWNLGPTIEVADAELIAITKALRTVLATAEKPTDCYIFSDSQAAILKLDGHSQAAVTAKRLITQLAHHHKTKIHIHWCPSHCGIQGNEMADTLAKAGLRAAPHPADILISTSYLRRVAKADMMDKWHKDWFEEQQREEVGLKTRGLGKLYRALVRDNLSFSLKPKLPPLP